MYKISSKDEKIRKNIDKYVRGNFTIEEGFGNGTIKFTNVGASSCGEDVSLAMKEAKNKSKVYGDLFNTFMCAKPDTYKLQRQSSYAE
jgi:hypothetical protein